MAAPSTNTETAMAVQVKKRDLKKGFGTLGAPIKLFANHYLVQVGFSHKIE